MWHKIAGKRYSIQFPNMPFKWGLCYPSKILLDGRADDETLAAAIIEEVGHVMFGDVSDDLHKILKKHSDEAAKLLIRLGFRREE